MSVLSVLAICLLLNRAALGVVYPQITPPPVVDKRSIANPAFEGYTSDFGSCEHFKAPQCLIVLTD